MEGWGTHEGNLPSRARQERFRLEQCAPYRRPMMWAEVPRTVPPV